MKESRTLDSLFQEAVSAIDEGDLGKLESQLKQHPQLVRERLNSPGAWLRDQVGKSLEGFYHQPYLLWFVAEDPVRNDRLPGNIAIIAHSIIKAGEREKVTSLQEQLDYAIRLVAWSWVARKCEVQIGLIDVLLDAGAAPHVANEALVNGNFAASKHLVERGAKLSLATALCLERWDEVARLGPRSNFSEKQFSLILAALNGKSQALAALIPFGVELNTPSPELYPHATALHHAVSSGSLEAVKVLVEAGAQLDGKDLVYNGTPIGWAEYGNQKEIAAYLREKVGS